MAQFRPFMWLITWESRNNYKHGFGKRESVYTEYKTYVELKNNIKQHLIESEEEYISVFRSRRGEWGEWFEQWQLINDKPTIIKEGWM